MFRGVAAWRARQFSQHGAYATYDPNERDSFERLKGLLEGRLQDDLWSDPPLRLPTFGTMVVARESRKSSIHDSQSTLCVCI